MSDITQYIGSSDYWYVPVAAFAFIMIVAGLLGAVTGWKTALYFLIWNIVALVPTVLTLGTISDTINSNLDVSGMEGMNLKSVIHDYGGYIVLVGVLLVTNLLAFVFYFIFRTKLKAKMKDNKRLGRSNAVNRFVGAGVGMVVALPITAFVTEEASLMSEDNDFTLFNGSIASTLTGGKLDGYDKGLSRTGHAQTNYKDDLKDLLNAIDDTAQLDALADAFKGSKPDATLLPKVQTLIDNPIVFNSLSPEFLKNKLGDSVTFPPTKFDTTGLTLDPAKRTKITNMLIQAYPAQETQIKNFFGITHP